MQFLKFSTLEIDSMPNLVTELLIDQGSRTELLIRDDSKNFYDIANMIEFNSLKLMFLLAFNLA
jgi:hypothetical protein